MKILLEAYLDRNFGDDLFVTVLTDHYVEHQFYLMDDESKGASLVNCSKHGNLHTVTEEEALAQINQFGAYVFVGGDFYPPYYSRYVGRVQRAKGIHENGGIVLVLGASLYKDYPVDSLPNVREFFAQVDVATFRDSVSYGQYKKMMPASCAFLTSDMMFALADMPQTVLEEKPDIRILGISIRKVMNISAEKYSEYCKFIAQLVTTHLNRDPRNEVRFLAFSTGSYDDRDTAEHILEMLSRALQERTEIVEYSRDVFAFINSVDMCDAVISTRFHALCTALVLGKPFFPINYEAKVFNLLEEIGYTGTGVAYGESISAEAVLDGLQQDRPSPDKLKQYLLRGAQFFDVSDVFLDSGCEQGADHELLMKLMRQLHAEQAENEKLQVRLAEAQREVTETKRKEQLTATQREDLQSALARAQQNRADCSRELASVIGLCNALVTTKAFKLVHLITRIRHQFFAGTRQQRKDFWKWVGGRFRHQPDLNHGYNPMFSIITPLQQIRMCLTAELPVSRQEKTHLDVAVQQPLRLPALTEQILQTPYNKPDIIMFSVIDYDFRFQRPQHFAKRFAENGHRVFYINANFANPECIREIAANLFTVSFMTQSCNAIYFNDQWGGFQQWILEKMESLVDTYAIRDAIMVLDYPNWMDVSQALHNRYGFAMVADYMDDATGFLGTTTKSLKQNCERMLRDCDLVVPSSQFLADIARKYTDKITIVRNGTEVEHFQRALEMEQHRQRPVIGYYGAVSHWFDWEKVCYVAKNLPQCDVVIIGAVTEYRDKLEGYENIKLLGEKDYQELPEHLAYFDVCLIPFETSTDLIKATNPVKFYEYLSAGKRVVATEIPELEPYRDRYVYMSNDNGQFLEYIRRCLNGEDTLASKEDCIAFAKENAWQSRYEAFAQGCTTAVPKVNVIVLTYNNLRLNRFCIDSILNNTAYPNYELIVLDNQSTDGTVEYLKELDVKQDPRVKVILNPENSGFAGGNNKAIEQSDGKYVVLLNNDTVVTRGWLTALVKHMELDPRCGMVGAVTNSIGNEQMIAVQYRNLREMAAFAYNYTRRHMGEVYRDVDRIPLFCTIIRKDMMDQYGLLDDGYKVGMFEDDDYTMLVKKAGYHFFAAEDCFVHHVNNASFKKLHPQEYKKIFDENRARFEKKWNTSWKMPKYRAEITADVNEGCMVEPIE